MIDAILRVLMLVPIIGLLLFFFSGCSSMTPYQRRTYDCMERIIDMGSNAATAYEVCEKMEGKR